MNSIESICISFKNGTSIKDSIHTAITVATQNSCTVKFSNHGIVVIVNSDSDPLAVYTKWIDAHRRAIS